MDTAGHIYGTTRQGGGGNCYYLVYNNNGCGVVFELSPPTQGQTAWTETILYRFTGGADGALPADGLVIDAAGNLYGTSSYGGAILQCAGGANVLGCGTMFELSPPTGGQSTWNFQVLFTSETNPIQGTLARDADDNLYGVTLSEAFKISPPANQATWTETQITDFGSYYTVTGMIFDSKGNLYGVNYQQFGAGVGDIFKLGAPTKGTRWDFNILARFVESSGEYPIGNLALDAAGNLYGTTFYGAHGGGAVYKLGLDGTLSVLHKFDGNRDGSEPWSSVVLDASGNIYGTSRTGGPNGNGAVWELLTH